MPAPRTASVWAEVLDLAGLSPVQRVLDAVCGDGACLRAVAADLTGFGDVA